MNLIAETFFLALRWAPIDAIPYLLLLRGHIFCQPLGRCHILQINELTDGIGLNNSMVIHLRHQRVTDDAVRISLTVIN